MADDYGEIIQGTFGGARQAAQAQVSTSVDDEPDKAARAIELGQSWGVPPTVVYSDMDNFEHRQKQTLAAGIVQNNPYIADYINYHPLAAKVSANDLGQMDAITDYSQKYGIRSVFGKAVEGFKRGIGEGRLGDWTGVDYTDPATVAAHPQAALWASTITGITDPFEAIARASSGVAFGVTGAIGEAARQAGISSAPQAMDDFASAIQDPGFWASIGPIGETIGLPFEIAGRNKELHDAVTKISPYIAAEKSPPVGLHPAFDDLHAEQAKIDVDNLNDLLKEVGKSETKELTPQLFADNFLAQHPELQGEIGIASDKIRELYAEKQPEPGDKILGDLITPEQLATAEATGGDVDVPLAQYLAKIDPEVHKELEDNIRPRPEGMTKEEAKEPRPIEAYHGSTAEFEAFDLDKIGTGQGAQSYGHGLYFAEEPAVAESYKQEGKFAPGEGPASDVLSMYKGDREAAIKELENKIAFNKEKMGDAYKYSAWAKDDEKALEFLKEGGQPRSLTGNVYRVHIHANKEEFLDFDKGLAGQPPEVQNLFKQWSESVGNEDFSEFGWKGALQDPRFTAKLKEAGIPGIRYLDQASRQPETEKLAHIEQITKTLKDVPDLSPETRANMEQQIRAIQAEIGKKPTSNFVLFDPSLVEITHRNGEAVRAVRQAAALEPLPVVEESAPKAAPEMVRREGPTPKQLELPQAGTTRIEDRPVAEAGALGLTKLQFQRFQKLIEERRQEDIASIKAKIATEERRRQTREWNENKTALRPEVVDQVNARPEVATMNALEEQGWKINPKTIPEEYKDIIPKKYLDKNGVSAEDLAAYVGAKDVDHLVMGYDGLVQDRGNMKSFTYRRKLIDAEVDRQMEAKYGKLDDNILKEAKDRVLSDTQEQLLHEQTMALAEKAGAEFTISKEALRAQAMEMIGETPIEGFTSDKYLAEAGRAGRAMQDAFLKKDYAEAFRQQQRQYLASIIAREARGLEVVRDKFETFAKKFAKRDVDNILPEYTNYIHDMLMRTGQVVRRTPEDLAEEMARGEYKSFDAFVQAKEANLRDLAVPDWMRDENFKKDLSKLSVNEFKEYTDALKSLEHNGRDELKLIRAGDKQDLQKIIDEMVEKIESLGPAQVREFKPEKKVSIGTAKAYWWSGITAESILRRLDRGDSKGVFTQTMTRMFSEASNNKDKLIKSFQEKLSALGDIPDMGKRVDNTLFKDPWSGDYIPMTKRNVLGVLQNVGNKSNLTKLAKGYGLDPAEIMAWLQRNTTKEDWDRAQKIGDTFEELFQMANDMSHRISGVGIQRVPLDGVDAGAFGQYPGWYNPIKYDRQRPGKSKALLGANTIEQEGYYKATTPQGYTKERTGYIAPVELSLDVVPQRMKQMIHDIAFRETVLQLSKIIHNKEIQSAVNAHFSPLVVDSFKTFLRDIANAGNFKSEIASMGDSALEVIRQNTIATLIGFNPSTVMKHGPTAAINSMTQVGLANFAREFATLATTDEVTGKTNWQMAMGKSEELQRRLRANFSQLIKNRDAELTLARTSYRDFMISAGATPVSISDLLSAVPTWLAEYKKQIALGEDEGHAVFQADTAVRNAHGSSTLTNRPEIMRTNAMGAMFSSLYGFFSHMMQRQYEMGWKAKDLLKDVLGKGSGDAEMATRHAPDLVKGLFSYIIAPAVIEELVTPYSNKEKESWGAKAATTLLYGLSSSLIGVRDFVHALVNLQDPQAGLAATSMKAAMDVARDLHKPSQMFTRQKAGNVIKHTATLAGVLTGLTNAQEGRTLEFLQRYSAGLEHPKGPWGTLVGMRYGTLKNHSQTLDQYSRGLLK